MRAAAAIDPRNRITHKNRPQKELSLPFEAGLLFFAGRGEAGEEKGALQNENLQRSHFRFSVEA